MIYRLTFVFTLMVILITFYACSDEPKTPPADTVKTTPAIPLINYSVVNHFPHDNTLFTEGFLMHNGQLFESTGSPDNLKQTKSAIGISDLNTGKFDKKVELDKTKYFGEGIVFFKNKLYQLTYKNQLGFIYDAKSFKKEGEFKYKNTEGWSLTTDGTDLIMSDGSSFLTFLNPVNLAPDHSLQVTENGVPRDSLNELEYIKGCIYANIWMNNIIVKIDPASGKVVGKLDLRSLTYEALNKNPQADVLNGVAYDSTTDRIFATGKLWSNIYQINFPH